MQLTKKGLVEEVLELSVEEYPVEMLKYRESIKDTLRFFNKSRECFAIPNLVAAMAAGSIGRFVRATKGDTYPWEPGCGKSFFFFSYLPERANNPCGLCNAGRLMSMDNIVIYNPHIINIYIYL